MKSVFQLLMASLLMSFLVGCATAPVVERNFAQQKRTVGVIAQADEEMERKFVGITVFSNKSEKVQLDRLNLDQIILNEITANFSKAGIQTKAIPSEGLGEIKPKQSDDALRKLAAENGVDYLIIAAPDQYGDFIFGTNQYLKGHGLYHRANPFIKDPMVAFYAGGIRAFDVVTGVWSMRAGATGYERLFKEWQELARNPEEKKNIEMKWHKLTPHHEYAEYGSLPSEEVEYLRQSLRDVTAKAMQEMLAELPINTSPEDPNKSPL